MVIDPAGVMIFLRQVAKIDVVGFVVLDIFIRKAAGYSGLHQAEIKMAADTRYPAKILIFDRIVVSPLTVYTRQAIPSDRG